MLIDNKENKYEVKDFFESINQEAFFYKDILILEDPTKVAFYLKENIILNKLFVDKYFISIKKACFYNDMHIDMKCFKNKSSDAQYDINKLKNYLFVFYKFVLGIENEIDFISNNFEKQKDIRKNIIKINWKKELPIKLLKTSLNLLNIEISCQNKNCKNKENHKIIQKYIMFSLFRILNILDNFDNDISDEDNLNKKIILDFINNNKNIFSEFDYIKTSLNKYLFNKENNSSFVIQESTSFPYFIKLLIIILREKMLK